MGLVSRITKWQRNHRSRVRAGLKKTVHDRVGRNKARRELERSDRAKKCVVCGGTTDLEVAHKDNHPANNALSNLEWRCKTHHKSHEGRYPKTLNKVPRG